MGSVIKFPSPADVPKVAHGLRAACLARIAESEAYLSARTGCFDYRRVRYERTLDEMLRLNLCDEDIVFDIGAGRTEFNISLRHYALSRAMYCPVDAVIDGTDLERWVPMRDAEFFVALELLEHLRSPGRLVKFVQRRTKKGFLISTPNPRTTDVLGMDSTHVTPISKRQLRNWDFEVYEESFYGQPADSLFAVWTP